MTFGRTLLVVWPVTFAVFFLEALMHYNIGKGTLNKNFQLPGGRDVAKILVVLFVASAISSSLSSVLVGPSE
jgi:hypothetical protein